MDIRAAKSDDIAALTRLKKPRLERHRLLFAENQRKRLLAVGEGKARYLVADRGEIVGHVFLQLQGTVTAPEYPEINDLYVRDDMRGQGIGRQLIADCEHIAKEMGFDPIGLSVNPTLNPRAKALYERLGYRDVGRPQYLGGVYDGDEDWVIDMVKPLGRAETPSETGPKYPPWEERDRVNTAAVNTTERRQGGRGYV